MVEFFTSPLGIILIVVIVLVLIVISIYNSLVRLRNRCDEAFSAMDVHLVKRYDLIPNLVETVKGYATHEKETLENVVKARTSAMNASDMESKLAAEGELSKALGRLMAITESYPDLKANSNFMDLQQSLKTMEAEIAGSRKYYNAIVNQYNTKIDVVPSNIVAGLFGFKKKSLFEVADEAQRQNVKVQF